ncbi:hypothetical protein SARC_05178 [Sphaeroforma arctica JP610]|uniref:Uncharacterized protein n=1 Tax=Sphaeroforma arctica JP610 TaxID=667725 RepID=A0A0L0G0D4_9EUKA|nr:hypothetical protein SARC_05178 [Sphaeroforma arctica JP610]KNC82530.1 hypothetical protein SARC_05178 [Sphaeroforma arctica JP610]|eukprot:XP_014156432.1 hypothetical protein SARC_05178 [Sphaeroforma arctica JP610]
MSPSGLKAEAKEKAEEIAAEAQKKTEEDAIKAYNRGSNNTGIQQPYPSKFGNPITASTIEYPMEVDLEDVVPISGIADERFKRNYYLFSEIFDGKKVTKKLKSSDPETKNQIRYLEEAEDQCEAEIEKMETDFSTKYGKRKSSQDMWMKDLKEVTKCKTKAALDAFVAARPNLQLPDITKDMLRSMPDYKTKRITASSAHKDAATATSSVRIAQL